jgi:TRAP-type mannitol/chloroaromatic compound transport system permease small subunit
MNRFLAKLESIADWSGKIASYFIFIVIAILLYEVTARYFFNKPTIWAHEITQLVFGGAAVLLGAYCLRHRQHIVIDVIYRLFPKRAKAIVDSVTILFIFWWVGLYLYLGFPYAWEAIVSKEASFTPLETPIWPIKLTIPIAGVLLLIQGLAMWIRSLYLAITGKELA